MFVLSNYHIPAIKYCAQPSGTLLSGSPVPRLNKLLFETAEGGL